MKYSFHLTLLAAILILLSGCASMQSHNDTANKVQAARQSGGIPAALAQLDASISDKESLLYNLERGELLRLNQQYPESIGALLKADATVKEWEEKATTNPDKLLDLAGAALISERLATYQGQDYEKVWLTTRLSMNRIAVNDLDNARVDIKRTHEREAVIAQLREKETVSAEQEAKNKGAQVQGKELNGYPVETLNDPEVLNLKNGFQNALSHYLAGYVYEVMGESGLAAPGYRKAIELRPGSAILEEGLRGLDDRTSLRKMREQKLTDVLFIVEAGSAPARESKAFTVPVFFGGKARTVSVSYPIIKPSTDPLLTALQISNGQTFPLEKVVDVNVMARRELSDRMPGMIFRNVTRAIAKGVLQDQLQKHAGVWGAVAGMVASAVTEQADDRIWRNLPGRVYVARGLLPEGEHRLNIQGLDLGSVKVSGRYTLVPLRLYDNSVILGQTSTFGSLPPPMPVSAPVKPEPEIKKADKPKKSGKPSNQKPKATTL